MEQPPLPSVPPNAPKTSPLAIWSLVLGVLSLVCFSILTAIPGVICGHKARKRIRLSGGALEGNGLALAGLITSYLSIVMAVISIPIILAIALPAFQKAQAMALVVQCQSNLQVIEFAKEQWAQENEKKPADIPQPDDINSFMDKPFSSLACPAGGKYEIRAVGEKPTCSAPNHSLKQ